LNEISALLDADEAVAQSTPIRHSDEFDHYLNESMGSVAMQHAPAELDLELNVTSTGSSPHKQSFLSSTFNDPSQFHLTAKSTPVSASSEAMTYLHITPNRSLFKQSPLQLQRDVMQRDITDLSRQTATNNAMVLQTVEDVSLLRHQIHSMRAEVNDVAMRAARRHHSPQQPISERSVSLSPMQESDISHTQKTSAEIELEHIQTVLSSFVAVFLLMFNRN